jgi:hypothetical protein
MDFLYIIIEDMLDLKIVLQCIQSYRKQNVVCYSCFSEATK